MLNVVFGKRAGRSLRLLAAIAVVATVAGMPQVAWADADASGAASAVMADAAGECGPAAPGAADASSVAAPGAEEADSGRPGFVAGGGAAASAVDDDAAAAAAVPAAEPVDADTPGKADGPDAAPADDAVADATAGSGDAPAPAGSAGAAGGVSHGDVSPGEGLPAGAGAAGSADSTAEPAADAVTAPAAAATATAPAMTVAATPATAQARKAAPALKNGWYSVKTKLNPAYALSVKGLSTKKGAKIVLKKGTGSAGAAFLVKKSGSRYRIYVGIGKGLYLELAGSKARTSDKKRASTLFSFEYDYGLGGYLIRNASGRALAVKSGRAESGAAIVGAAVRPGSAAQAFVLEGRPGLLKENIYTVRSTQKGKRALTADGSKARFHGYEKSFDQKWHIAPVAGKANTYTIESISNGRFVLGTKNKAMKVKTSSTSSKAAWWQPRYVQGGIVWKNVKTKKPLATAGKKCPEGSAAMNRAQKAAKATVFKVSSVRAVESGVYELQSKAGAGYVIAAPDSAAAGDGLQMRATSGGNAQTWVYDAAARTFENAGSGLMLQAGTDVDSSLVQAAATGAAAQQWDVEYAGAGSFQLVSRENGAVVVTAAAASDGAGVQTAVNRGAKLQKWVVAPASLAVAHKGFKLIKSIVNYGHGKLDADYIVIHETANPGATAKNHRDLWAGKGYYADYAVHYTMDWTKNCYYCVPENRKCWQVGNGNAHVIGIELCHATNKADFKKVWDGGVQWAAWQLKKHGWGIDRLLSHNDCRKKWGGTDHTDPDSYFETYGKTWKQFKSAVEKELNR